jgi:DNA anti-recombination protein RmuC
MSIRENVISFLLSAALGVGGAAVTTWKQVGELKAELVHVKDDLAEARKTLLDHQEDIKKMYAIDGKLGQVVEEIKQLRADLRDRRSRN